MACLCAVIESSYGLFIRLASTLPTKFGGTTLSSRQESNLCLLFRREPSCTLDYGKILSSVLGLSTSLWRFHCQFFVMSPPYQRCLSSAGRQSRPFGLVLYSGRATLDPCAHSLNLDFSSLTRPACPSTPTEDVLSEGLEPPVSVPVTANRLEGDLDYESVLVIPEGVEPPTL
jgi:hypothetical protein